MLEEGCMRSRAEQHWKWVVGDAEASSVWKMVEGDA